VTVEPTSPVPETVFDPVAGIAATDGTVDLVSISARTGVDTDAPPWVRVAPSVTQKVSGLSGAVGATVVANVKDMVPVGNTTVLGRVHAAWRFPLLNVQRSTVLNGVKVKEVSPGASNPTYRVFPEPASKMVFGGATNVKAMLVIGAPVPLLSQYA
jgi:predicted phage tail protein